MESASPYFVLIPFPTWNRPNLTVLTHALVTRITFEGKRATGVECIYNGKTHRIRAGLEVVLSLGAIHTPKVLMQSGIGDQAELERHGIPLVQHLPGVGQNFQDQHDVPSGRRKGSDRRCATLP
jgi:choline dehydrogenase